MILPTAFTASRTYVLRCLRFRCAIFIYDVILGSAPVHSCEHRASVRNTYAPKDIDIVSTPTSDPRSTAHVVLNNDIRNDNTKRSMSPSFQEIGSHLRSLFHVPAWDTPLPRFGPGAFIPQELFFHILRFVGERDQALDDRLKYGRDLTYQELEFALRNVFPLSALRNCALVCRYWANQSRAYLFTGATIKIRSLEDAELFRKYAVAGSSHLNRICDLCGSLEVEQEYSSRSQRSFLDLLYMPETRGKLKKLTLIGPRMEDLGGLSFMLDTPHWGLPNVSVVASSMTTSYKEVAMDRMDFPSIFHIFKYVKHFRGAVSVRFDSLTWIGKEDPLRPRTRVAVSSLRTSRALSFQAVNCTDNLLVCWQMAMIRPDFALWTVTPQDQQWAIDLSRTLYSSFTELPSMSPGVHFSLSSGKLISPSTVHTNTDSFQNILCTETNAHLLHTKCASIKVAIRTAASYWHVTSSRYRQGEQVHLRRHASWQPWSLSKPCQPVPRQVQSRSNSRHPWPILVSHTLTT